MTERIIGIMGAMPEEITGVVDLLGDKEEFHRGRRSYFTGRINGIKTVVVFSRWGKVAAATTITHLILEFNITEVIFTGVAGSVNPSVHIGDIVVANRLIQHDMDARPLMRQFEIPLLGKTFIESDPQQVAAASVAVNRLIEAENLHLLFSEEGLNRFGISRPQLFVGDIASGDKFFSGEEEKQHLLQKLPSVLCVEMEGAAVAQVCLEYEIPFAIIRTISDSADEQAPIDFPAFIKEISSKYSVAILQNWYNNLVE